MSINLSLQSVQRFFLSRKVAVTLLAATLALLILSTRLQNISDLTASPFFLVIPLLIFISTFLCTVNRIRTRKAKPPDASAFKIRREVVASDLSGLRDCLNGRGWAAVSGDGASMFFIKGAEGFWGSMVFHAGLLLMLIAAVISSATLFSAELLLPEGLPTPIGRTGFLKVWRDPLVPVRFSEGEIVLEKFEAVYEEERFPVDFIARVKVSRPGEEGVFDVRVNDPLNIGQLQYTMDRYGFSPGFLIKDRSGNVLFDGYVTLVLMGGAEDSFDLPGADATLLVRFFPDFVMTGEGPSTRSRIPKNPVFGLRIKRGDERGKGKLVRMGEEAEIDGLVIAPNDLRYWAHFGVARDMGQGLFTVSFVLIVASLVFRFFHHERWLRVSLAKKGDRYDMEVSGYSRYFPALFEGEVARIADEIARL